MSHIDKLGVPIKVRDIVVTGSGSYADISIGVVTKLNPIMIQVNGSGNANPSESLVITDMYKTEKPVTYLNLMDRFKDKFDDTTKVRRPKLRYCLKVNHYVDSNRVALILLTMVDGKVTNDTHTLGDFVGYNSLMVVRVPKGRYSSAMSDELTLCARSYHHDTSKYLPAKFIRKTLGGVPTDSEIVTNFTDLDQCKSFLTSKGVKV